jgi:hypothetical protein
VRVVGRVWVLGGGCGHSHGENVEPAEWNFLARPARRIDSNEIGTGQKIIRKIDDLSLAARRWRANSAAQCHLFVSHDAAAVIK